MAGPGRSKEASPFRNGLFKPGNEDSNRKEDSS